MSTSRLRVFAVILQFPGLKAVGPTLSSRRMSIQRPQHWFVLHCEHSRCPRTRPHRALHLWRPVCCWLRCAAVHVQGAGANRLTAGTERAIELRAASLRVRLFLCGFPQLARLAWLSGSYSATCVRFSAEVAAWQTLTPLPSSAAPWRSSQGATSLPR